MLIINPTPRPNPNSLNAQKQQRYLVSNAKQTTTNASSHLHSKLGVEVALRNMRLLTCPLIENVAAVFGSVGRLGRRISQ
jgi:hypothetical protein